MGSPILDYATPKPSPPSQLARWIARLGHAIGRCPTWVLTMILMALVGMAMVWLPSWSPWHRVKEWLLVTPLFLAGAVKQIGRASCRERV